MIPKWLGALAVLLMLSVGGIGFAEAQSIDYDDAFAARVANPGDTDTLAAFLTAAVQRGEYDQAISTVEQHLINHPRDAKARLIAARLYFHLGSWELARRQVMLAIEIGTLSPDDTEDAEDLLADIEERIEGVVTMAFLTGGVRATYTDYDQWNGAPLDDRVDITPFVAVGGSVSIDLNTPTSDALILRGSLSAQRQFGDFDFDGTGSVFIAWSGDVAATLSKGLPGLGPTLRGDFTAYWRSQGLEDGLMRHELGVSKRLSARPSSNSLIFFESGLGWLGASSDELPGEWRGHLEGGVAARSPIGTFGVTARGFRDFDAAFDAIGQTGEVELSYSGVVAPIGDAVWQQRISGARGVIQVPDVNNPGTSFDGQFWRVGWDHVLQFESGHRANLGVSYRATEFDLTPDRNTNVLSAMAGFTFVLD